MHCQQVMVWRVDLVLLKLRSTFSEIVVCVVPIETLEHLFRDCEVAGTTCVESICARNQC